MKRNSYTLILIAIFGFLTTISCDTDDRDLNFLNNVPLPSGLRLEVNSTQDNSGAVTLTPFGDNASTFILDFGDGSQSDVIEAGASVTNMYAEGTYEVTITATNINGETAQGTQSVMVSFLPPANLVANVSPVAGDNFSISVSATADFATSFEVYFGDVTNEMPTALMVGESVDHTYPSVGTYELRVVALNGGSQTTEVTETVVIVDPLALPIDFESTTLNYNFINFGGAAVQVASNPDATAGNSSANVAEFFKEPGAEVFAGTVLELGTPIDFSTDQVFVMNSYAPESGVIVKMKIENATNGDIAAEIDATTTIVNGWEQLSFDFSGADLTQEYAKIVVFYDFGNAGTGTTYYFDDIQLSASLGVRLPVDFENPDLDYGIIGFEGAEAAIEANPDASGLNTSDTVLRTIKTDGAQFFAGTIVALDEAIDFSTTQSITIQTYSPKADIPVRLKLENADNSAFLELDVNTTVTNQWEELTWDFSGMDTSAEFVRVIVFFEFIVDLPGDGSTYYYDNIRLGN